MILSSRGPAPDVPPLEMGGIRYQQVKEGLTLGLPVRCGYLQAIDISSGKSLWILQVYQQTYDPEIEGDIQEIFFLRMKWHADTREILVENEIRSKYLINIDTQQVRKANPTDFPPKIDRAPPPEVPPIDLKGVRYAQVMNGFQHCLGERCGFLQAIDLKTGRRQWDEEIYHVPFNPDIEDDLQECYFTRMILLPGEQDILIENEAGAKYLFNIKSGKATPFTGKESDYQAPHVSLFERIKDACRELWRRWKS